MKETKRVADLPEYPFAKITRKINAKRAAKVDVISFAIGEPDMPTPPHIIDALVEASRDAATHKYPDSDGLPELRSAMAGWYQRRFGVTLDPGKEVVPLIGSKEGIGQPRRCGAGT